MWRRTFDVLFWLGLSLAFGGTVAIGALVAPAVFDTTRSAQISMPGIASPPLDMANQAGGEIFGIILQRFAYFEAAALALLLIAIAGWILSARQVRRSTWVLAGLWLLVTALAAYDAASLSPQVWSLRQTIRDQAPSHAQDAADARWPERSQFDTLHRRAELLGQLRACALLAMILIAGWRSRPIKSRIEFQAPRSASGTFPLAAPRTNHA